MQRPEPERELAPLLVQVQVRRLEPGQQRVQVREPAQRQGLGLELLLVRPPLVVRMLGLGAWLHNREALRPLTQVGQLAHRPLQASPRLLIP